MYREFIRINRSINTRVHIGKEGSGGRKEGREEGKIMEEGKGMNEE